jgi:glycyl-tRNA synthetase
MGEKCDIHGGSRRQRAAMENLYERNGLVFWSEDEIRTRELFVMFFVQEVTRCLKEQNRAFEVVRVEAPLLTPRALVSASYGAEDMFVLDDLVLRPETTMGSFAAARALLDPHARRRFKLPLCVWQHGRSFRREQDQPTRHMRLKEFHQLELQILFAPSTANDYATALVPCVQRAIAAMIGRCRVEPSERLPAYSEWTKDVVWEKASLEVCSISRRKDFAEASVLEVAIGTDRCVYAFTARAAE